MGIGGRSAALTAVIAVSLLGAAAAGAHGIEAPDLPEAELRAYETEVLGPEHAAEHAGIRMLARMQARAWKRMTPAQRRRQQRLERRRRRALARSSATLDPAVYGKWTSGPFQLPVAAIHAALLPTGKVLIFAFPFYPSTNPPSPTPVAGDAWVWDPAIDPNPDPNADPTTDPAFHHVLPPYDPETGGPASLFCAGLSMLPNGDVLVTGGTLYFADANRSQALGLKRAYTFNPWTETWIQQPDMLHGRWYPSQVELPDGRVAVLAGSNETTGANNYQLEVFSPTDDPSGVGSWAHPASADRSTDLYPHMTLMGNGKVLLAGPGQNDTALLDPATWKWSGIPAQDGRRTYGTEMIEPNGLSIPAILSTYGTELIAGQPVRHLVSLGSLCLPSIVFKNNGLKKYSLPFDWIYSSPAMVIDCLQEDFATFLDRRHYASVTANRPSGEPGADHRFYLDKYGIGDLFAHRDPTEDEDYQYTVRTVERWRTVMRSDDAKLFVLVSRPKHQLPQIFESLVRELEERTRNFAILGIEVESPSGQPAMFSSEPIDKIGQHTLYRFTPSSYDDDRSVFPDKLDEWAFLRMVFRFRLDLRESAP